ncbi:MAG: hemerythrin [Chloroflexi bacterium HGW-Chloroflexi-10]|nr:MAG: hemerythrin [Chloroflexi bacterium HGW-Chloroflexi-10]
MALIQWDQKYSVKIAEIDKEHLVLVNLINDLHEAMRNGQGKIKVSEILDGLVAYTRTHFAHEEIMLTQSVYPDLAAHKQIHKNLIKQVENLQKKNREGSLTLSMEVMSFLKDWLLNHVQGEDFKYSDYMNAKGIY